MVSLISGGMGEYKVRGNTTPQKPLDMIANAIENSSEVKELCVDFFLGSGSTLIACEKTGRVCYGMEIDPPYADVIIQRWVDYTGKRSVIKNGRKMRWG